LTNALPSKEFIGAVDLLPVCLSCENPVDDDLPNMINATREILICITGN
jgi:hypothetical protein